MTAMRWLGVVLRAIVLGILLFLAVGELLALESDARVFQYEAY